MESMTLVAAINKYFGKKPGQTAGEYMQEIRELTTEDRVWYAREFERVGYKIIPAPGSDRI